MDTQTSSHLSPLQDYHSTAFSAGKMAFAWEEWTAEERQKAYANWAAGRGLIGGDPRHRPGAYELPPWGLDQPFFRTLALDDHRVANKERLTAWLLHNTMAIIAANSINPVSAGTAGIVILPNDQNRPDGPKENSTATDHTTKLRGMEHLAPVRRAT